MANIETITLPDGVQYDITDTTARSGGIDLDPANYVGETTTVISVGLKTADYIDMDGNTQTASEGTIVAYNNELYVWDGDQWIMAFFTVGGV